MNFDTPMDWTDDGYDQDYEWANPTTGRTYDRLVDAAPAFAHIRRLIAAGWARVDIAEKAGVAHNTVSNWTTAGGRARPDRIRAEIAANVLAITGPAPGRERAAGGDPWRRLASLFDREQAAREWLERAACRGMDPNLFFPGQGDSVLEAKAVCARCPVRSECLEHALANGERYGVRGGLSEKQRRKLRNDRRAAA